MIKTDNVNYDVFLQSFQKLDSNSNTYNLANLFLLEMIKALDKLENDNKKEKLYNACLEFSDWLCSVPDNEMDNQVKLLNKFN